MTEREALKLAIKTLRQIELASSATVCNTRWISGHAKDNAAKLEEALEQQEESLGSCCRREQTMLEIYEDALRSIILMQPESLESTKAKRALEQVRGGLK